MADSNQASPDPNTPKASGTKDKNCPYCGQAFTSSSLGRHLDLYIKEKNPKPADGIHDVEAIKKLRGSITRRQPRGSLGGRRRDGSTPASTPKSSMKKETSSADSDGYKSPAIPKEGQYVVDSTTNKYGFTPRWEATGVMNDIPDRNGSVDGDGPGKQPRLQRTVSKQVVHKAQFDVKQKLADAVDTARAAELALRELLSSLRAAKQHIDSNSMPFDFDPLSLDFPALTLQCLQPPPTLYSSTQHPTSTSWSVQAPAQREFRALQAYFQEQFRSWKLACASATTAAAEELTYPPKGGPLRDARDAVKQAEKSAENLEKQVEEHLMSAYAAWEAVPLERQNELWVLELARGVGRKHKETEKLKEQQHSLKQENSALKAQIDQLNRLQHPREFSIHPPTTIPVDRDLIAQTYGLCARVGKGVGMSLDDRHVDLGTAVSRSIERWKSVIISSRATANGLSAQKALDQPAPSAGAGGNVNGASQAQPSKQLPAAQPPQQSKFQQQQQQQHAPLQHPQPQQQQVHAQQLQQHASTKSSAASTNGAMSEHTVSSAATTAPPSVEDTSDQDADAEMEDDDSFAIMNASPTKPMTVPMQQQPTLDVPRTRAPVQHRPNPDPRFMMQNGAGNAASRAAMAMSRSIPNMSLAMQNAAMHGAEMGMTMQGVRGDPMYLE
ncbi:hypothetical protein S7711_05187 [Stachybotrys chartarum IBT 7711]|uniref:Uncharacterized protein n=1 Tax=Stachybotrys chartarum (strain CBS 109288 / IBT 7711) TaxID=1280523 RepID=A0A084ANF3_STACB|nr:hypothetical protein S7711_05187 [Stachybotrys chartarum IBT 7711]KFA53109.1 hypothetical protein S40293_03170 [Stachybotrys chartarum IBT 40293]